MSQEDVDLVRRFWDAFERSFDSYWENPGALADALESGDLRPEQREAFGCLHPDIVWRPSFLSDELRGYSELLEAAD